MSADAATPRLLLAFGLLGAPVAWTLQHVTGYALTEAACSPAGRGSGLPLDALTVAVTAAAALVAVLAAAASVAAWRATRSGGEEPAESRRHFLAVIGMTIAPLFLLIILMSGVGATLLAKCVQS